MFSPFKSHGRIIIHLTKTEQPDLTKIKCEIYPRDNSLQYILGFILLIFLLWTMFLIAIGLLVGMTFLISKMVIFAIVFCVPVFFIFIRYRIAKAALTEYSEYVIKLISK